MLYIASSWRNMFFDSIVERLTEEDIDHYNFKKPAPNNNGFHWSEIDREWEHWTPEQYCEALTHPLAKVGFKYDMTALRKCSRLLLVLPCGASAHLELGHAIGAGKTVLIYFPADIMPPQRMMPELMYMAADFICLSMDEVLSALESSY